MRASRWELSEWNSSHGRKLLICTWAHRATSIVLATFTRTGWPQITKWKGKYGELPISYYNVKLLSWISWYIQLNKNNRKGGRFPPWHSSKLRSNLLTHQEQNNSSLFFVFLRERERVELSRTAHVIQVHATVSYSIVPSDTNGSPSTRVHA